MQISVTIEHVQPLTGTASTSGERPVSFVGWLELLRAIAELTESTTQRQATPQPEASGQPEAIVATDASGGPVAATHPSALRQSADGAPATAG